jgi:hypothetical protein
MSLIIRRIGLLLTLVFDFALFARNSTVLFQSGADAQSWQDYTVENQPSPYYQDGHQNALQFHDLIPHYWLHLKEETPPQKPAITCRPSVRIRKRGR